MGIGSSPDTPAGEQPVERQRASCARARRRAARSAAPSPSFPASSSTARRSRPYPFRDMSAIAEQRMTPLRASAGATSPSSSSPRRAERRLAEQLRSGDVRALVLRSEPDGDRRANGTCAGNDQGPDGPRPPPAPGVARRGGPGMSAPRWPLDPSAVALGLVEHDERARAMRCSPTTRRSARRSIGSVSRPPCSAAPTRSPGSPSRHRRSMSLHSPASMRHRRHRAQDQSTCDRGCALVAPGSWRWRPPQRWRAWEASLRPASQTTAFPRRPRRRSRSARFPAPRASSTHAQRPRDRGRAPRQRLAAERHP